MDILRVENVSKSFGGNKVIDGLSFAVPENSVFGFLGQNGAGKTTTMKMALGLLKPDGGEMYICGEQVSCGQTNTNRHIGYLPDVPEFYPYMRPKEYLRLCGEITGLSNDIIKSRGAELLALVGLEGVNKKIGGFSRGMKQRLGIAQALLNEPKLLICDEPTSALDPIGRKEILDILQQVKGKTTVVFSTHILSDVERICDRIAVISKGRLVLSGTIQELKARHRADGLTVEFASPGDLDRFMGDPHVAPYTEGAAQNGLGVTLHVNDMAAAQTAVIETLAQGRILPLKLEVMEPTIESLFLEVTK
ncbi:MAG: ABC transporter ATP-binding protein [Oscillospiraceae bacterium]|jgi:ABC-2 type transport system ATP-binding protein|nr:ABC transporter ATP-binding protein [Oscillospiraceae bacterium]